MNPVPTWPDDDVHQGRQLAAAEGVDLVHRVTVGAPQTVIAGDRVAEAGSRQRRQKLWRHIHGGW